MWKRRWKKKGWKEKEESPQTTTLSVAQTIELHRKTTFLMRALYSESGESGEQEQFDVSQPIYFAKHTSRKRG
jgi:hypothetical protein